MSKNQVVVFVPGIMGSELRYVGPGRYGEPVDEPVWGERVETLIRTLSTTPERLRRGLSPGKVLSELTYFGKRVRGVYGPLFTFLTTQLGYTPGVTLRPFGYDWRADNRESARLLGDFIQKVDNDGDKSLVLIAHSMGGLVSRLMLNDPANRSTAERISLFVQIGSPVAGSAKVLYSLKVSPEFGKLDILLRLRETINPNLSTRLCDVLHTFDSMFQLLPHESEQVLFSQNGEGYTALDLHMWPNHGARLSTVREVHESISSCSFPRIRTFYSAGIKTDRDYQIDQDFNILTRSSPHTVNGDGSVSVFSAVFDSPLDARKLVPGTIEHDEIPNCQKFFEFLREELAS